MKKVLFAIAAVALLFATSCNKTNEPTNLAENEFFCQIDNGANPQNAPRINDGMGTMTTISGFDVLWTEGDQIYHAETGTVLTCGTISSTGATFTGEGNYNICQSHTAYYPASLHTDNGLVLPSNIAIDATMGVDSLPMYAHNNNGTDHTLVFSNICAALKINVPVACDRIVVSADQAICGQFSVVNNAAVLAAGQSTDGVTLTGTFAKNDVVYAAIPAGTYNNFSIKFYNGTAEVGSKSLTQSQTFDVNKAYNVTVNLIPADGFHFEALAANSNISFNGADLLQYYDTTNGWTDYTANTVITLANVGDKVYFRARQTQAKLNKNKFQSTAGSLKVAGNITYLLNQAGTGTTLTEDDTYYQLFHGLTQLVDASELVLPATQYDTCSSRRTCVRY